MRNLTVLAVAAALLVAIFVGKGQDAEQSKAERYIKEGEAAWAEAGPKVTPPRSNGKSSPPKTSALLPSERNSRL